MSFLMMLSMAFFLVLLVLQIGIYAFVSHVSATAARQASQTASAENSSNGEGAAVGQAFIDQAGGNWVEQSSVNTRTSGTNTVTVVVTRAMKIMPLPGVSLRVKKTAVSKAERFYNANEAAG